MLHLYKHPSLNRPVHLSRDSWVFYLEPVPTSQQFYVFCSPLEFEERYTATPPFLMSSSINIRHVGSGIKFIFSGHDALFHWMVTEEEFCPIYLQRKSFERTYVSPLRTAIYDSTYAGRIVIETPALGMHDINPEWDDVNWEILSQQAVWTDMNSLLPSDARHFGDESLENKVLLHLKGELLEYETRSNIDGSSYIPYHLLVTDSGWFFMLRHVIANEITGFERVREIKMHCNFNDDVIFREIIEMQSKDFDNRRSKKVTDQDIEMLVLFHEVKKLDIRGKYIGESKERMVRNVRFTPSEMKKTSVGELDLPDDKIEFLLANLGCEIELIERETKTRIQIIPFFRHSHGWNAAAVPPRVAHVYGLEPNVEHAKSCLTTLLLRNNVVKESNSHVEPCTLPSLDLKSQDTSSDGFTSVEKELHKECHTMSARSYGTVTWTIRNVSCGISKEHFSKTFDVGPFQWKIMITLNEDSSSHLSMYLNLARTGYFSDRLIYAWFTLSLVNHIDRKRTIRKVAKHHFNIHDVVGNWGFPSVILFKDLVDPEKGYCKDDSCRFEAEVAVHRVMNYWSHGSKKETDYVYQINEQKRMKAADDTAIKVACEDNFLEQIGKDIYFDLVDYDKLPELHFPNKAQLSSLKELFSQNFGVPQQSQRFWIWAQRENLTHRAYRPLTAEEEAQSIGELMKFIKAEGPVRLFLENSESVPSPNYGMSILLFIKLYDQRKEELRYMGRFYVERADRVSKIFTKLKEKAVFPLNEEIELYEEICYEPDVKIRRINKNESFGEANLEDGDIVCIQICIPGGSVDERRYRDLYSFLNYRKKRSLKAVRLRSLEKPEKDEYQLNLTSLQNYDEVVGAVATIVGSNEPSKIRLTRHNCFSQMPDSQPIKYRGIHHLSDILVHHNWKSDILYYEVLDIPLPELQDLKTLKVAFHDATKDEVVIHTISLPKQSTVGDVIFQLERKVELSNPNSELILVGKSYDKRCKIFSRDQGIENINGQYRTLHAQEMEPPREGSRVVQTWMS